MEQQLIEDLKLGIHSLNQLKKKIQSSSGVYSKPNPNQPYHPRMHPQTLHHFLSQRSQQKTTPPKLRRLPQSRKRQTIKKRFNKNHQQTSQARIYQSPKRKD